MTTPTVTANLYCSMVNCYNLVPPQFLGALDQKVKKFSCNHKFCDFCAESVSRAQKCPECKAGPSGDQVMEKETETKMKADTTSEAASVGGKKHKVKVIHASS